MSYDMVVPLKTGFRGKTFNIQKEQFSKQALPITLKPVTTKRGMIGGKGREWGSDIYKLLVQMGKREEAHLYMQPVDPVKHSEFYSMVPEPLDLSKIQLNIHGGHYSELHEVCSHVTQMFHNLMRLYRDPDSREHVSLVNVLGWFNQEAEKIRVKNDSGKPILPRPIQRKNLVERIDAIEKHNRYVVGAPFILQPNHDPSIPPSKLLFPPFSSTTPRCTTSLKTSSTLLSSLSSSSITPSSQIRPKVQKVIVSYGKEKDKVIVSASSPQVNSKSTSCSSNISKVSRDEGVEQDDRLNSSSSLNDVHKPSMEYVLLHRQPKNKSNKLLIINPNKHKHLNPFNAASSSHLLPTPSNTALSSKVIPTNHQNNQASPFSINIIDNSSTDLLILSFHPSILFFGAFQSTTDQPIVLTDEGFNVPWPGGADASPSQLHICPSDLLRCSLGFHGNQHILFLFFLPHFATQVLSRCPQGASRAGNHHNSLVILTDPLNRQQSSLLLSFLYSFHHQSIFATSLFSELNQEAVHTLLKSLKIELASPSSSSSSSSSVSLSSTSSNIPCRSHHNNIINNISNNKTNNHSDNAGKQPLVISSALFKGASKSHTGINSSSSTRTTHLHTSDHNLLFGAVVNGDTSGDTIVKQEPPDEDFLEFKEVTNLPHNHCYHQVPADDNAGEDEMRNEKNEGQGNLMIHYKENNGNPCADDDNDDDGEEEEEEEKEGEEEEEEEEEEKDAGALENNDDDDYEYGKKKRKKKKGRKTVPKKKKKLGNDGDCESDDNNKNSITHNKVKKSKLLAAYDASSTLESNPSSVPRSTQDCQGDVTETDSEKTDTVDEDEVYDDCFNDTNDDVNDDFKQEQADVYLTYEQQPSTCPITQAPLRHPLQNPVCGHVYDRKGVEQLILMRAQKARCPVYGCHNNQPLQLSHLVAGRGDVASSDDNHVN